MADYFTSEHFKLLNKWRGQKRDDSNPEQNNAYEELKKAYEITEAWANQLKAEFFPTGKVDCRKRPTNQANNFQAYNWARIYPSLESPKALAYTVGIEADHGFVVKIDLVVTHVDDPALRQQYEQIRGGFTSSPIVAILPVSQGLDKSLTELVAWSVEAIRNFRFRYDELVAKLDLSQKLSDEDLLKHFDGKPAFKTFRASWAPEDRVTFCKLARAVHAAGLDWWHVGIGVQVRFGRKNPGSERAVGVLAVIEGTRTRSISWTRDVGDVPKLNREPLTEDWVTKIEAALAADREALDDWLVLETERPGLWPDQLRDDPTESDDESDIEEPPTEDAVTQAFNRIYYGPPGTGKTYEVTKLLHRDYEQSMTSVSETEWKSEFIAAKVANLTWWEGAAIALEDLGGRSNVDAILNHPFMKAIASKKSANKSPRNTVWGALQYHTIESSKTVKTTQRMAPAVFDKNDDSTWKFAGDWENVGRDLKSLVSDYRAGPPKTDSLKRFSFVTFHQSYGYEEFVEGLRPVLDDDTESGAIKYEIRSGAFKELCHRARQAPDQRFAMVIDEINRGNISKIFGELITLIEPDKREGAETAISVTLPYSGESFSVPANVDIIGTMNTADRSLALLDTALRRRFDFEPVLADARDEEGAPLFDLRVKVGVQEIDIPKMLSIINQRIEALYDRDHCIGHAYFTSLAKITDEDERFVALSQVFSKRIIPLLEEYFFEDWQKIRLVLADNQKPEKARFVTESRDHEDDLAHLFGSDHGLAAYATKQRYVIRDASFSNPDAYIGIYQSLSA
jgi:5-methylcytosine-specific restriction protein B